LKEKEDEEMVTKGKIPGDEIAIAPIRQDKRIKNEAK
jgi:hypothetical protein